MIHRSSYKTNFDKDLDFKGAFLHVGVGKAPEENIIMYHRKAKTSDTQKMSYELDECPSLDEELPSPYSIMDKSPSAKQPVQQDHLSIDLSDIGSSTDDMPDLRTLPDTDSSELRTAPDSEDQKTNPESSNSLDRNTISDSSDSAALNTKPDSQISLQTGVILDTSYVPSLNAFPDFADVKIVREFTTPNTPEIQAILETGEQQTIPASPTKM